MKKGRIGRVLCAGSLAGGIGLMAWGVVSFFVVASAWWNGSASNVVVFVNHGHVAVIYQRGPGMGASYWGAWPRVQHTWGANCGYWGWAGARRVQWDLVLHPEHRDLTNPPGPAGAIWLDGFYVPLWVLALVVGMPWGVRTVRRWGRPPVGCCQTCGYDLRASPGRCPECGTAVAGRHFPTGGGGGTLPAQPGRSEP